MNELTKFLFLSNDDLETAQLLAIAVVIAHAYPVLTTRCIM